MIKSFILIITLFFSIGSIKSQDKWDLKRCIEYALENNISVKQGDLDVQIANENLKQSKASRLPSLNANGSNNYNFGQRIDPFTNQFASTRVRSNSFSLNSSFTLFSGFQTANSIKRNSFDYIATKYRSDKIKNDISLSIANAYLQILFNIELEKLAKKQLQVTTGQLERFEQLVNSGSIPEGDKLAIEAQMAQEKSSLINAQNQVQLSYLNLRQILQLGDESSFEIVLPELGSVDNQLNGINPNLVFNQSVQIMPEIKGAEYDVKSSEKSVSIAKGSASPTVTVGASYGTGYSGASQEVIGSEFAGQVQIGETTTGIPVLADRFSSTTRVTPFGDQLENNLNQTVGISLSIPIFNGYSSKTSINRAKFRMEQANFELERAKIKLKNDIENAYTDAVASYENYTANQKSVNAQTKAFQYSQERYNADLINSVEFNTEKNNLTRAESALIQAKYDCIFKIKVLDFFQGKSLNF